MTSEIRFLLIINFPRRRAGLFSVFPRDSLGLLLRANLAHGVPGRPAGTSQLADTDGNLGRSLLGRYTPMTKLPPGLKVAMLFVKITCRWRPCPLGIALNPGRRPWSAVHQEAQTIQNSVCEVKL